MGVDVIIGGSDDAIQKSHLLITPPLKRASSVIPIIPQHQLPRYLGSFITGHPWAAIVVLVRTSQWEPESWTMRTNERWR